MDPTAAGLGALAIAGWFVGSIVYRVRSGKGLFARADPDAVFVERWASGRTGNGIMARLSTARNCLQVQLTATELIVTPHFPFTLGFMPELYDYDKRIRLDAVRQVSHVGGRLARIVELAYARPNGAQGVLLLRLAGGARFAELVHAASADHAAAPGAASDAVAAGARPDAMDQYRNGPQS